jgi:glycosyltransferase involved in cell wall biosynthesis
MLPSWYPSPHFPLNGIFFREWAAATRRAVPHLGVIYPDLRSLRTFEGGGVWQNRFQIEFMKDEGVPTFTWRGWNLPGFNLRRQMFVRAARVLARRYIANYGTPDLLHAQFCFWGGVAARVIAEELGIPYVLTEVSSIFLREQLPPPSLHWATWAFDGAAKVMACSQALADCIRPIIPGKSINIVPNMTDTEYFVMNERRMGHNYRVLAVAELNANKGIDVLIKAFTQAFKGDSSATLTIGGNGPERGTLELLAQELGVINQVRFLGELEKSQVRQEMWDADLFVLSSYRETFGLVLVEAMSTGLPVVATRGGGPQDIVKPGTGWLVDPGNSGDLATALLLARQERKVMNPTLIRNSVTSRFSHTVVTDQIRQLYLEALHGNRYCG